ncbi:MAG: PEGA domain-containing protein [Candidatus Wildermuthbacteria bacterium]|nr:PEGA domain-containing protein [Candidatus Wildermuthbacteria bacterium]
MFFIVSVFFLALSAFIVLYSLGYKIDWRTRTITQTGALYIKAVPPSATIYIEGQPTKRTSIFAGSALISDLFPGNYKVRIEKEGYSPWEKILEIRANEAAEAKNVFLFPSEIIFRITNTSVKNAWLAPNGIYAVLLEETDAGSQLVFWDTRANAKTLLRRLSSPKESIARVQWSSDSSRILIQALQDAVESAFVASSSPQVKLWCEELICPVILDASEAKTVQFSPVSSNRLLALQKLPGARAVTEIDYITQEHFSFWGTNVLAFFVDQNKLYWLEQDGSLWVKELAFASSPQHAVQTSFVIQPGKTYDIFSFKNRIFVKENSNLFVYVQRQETFSRIADNVTSLIPAPDYEKLLVINGSELWVYYLQDQMEAPRKKKGAFVFLNRFNERLHSPLWITGGYVAFLTGDTLKIAEIDDRSNINTYTVLDEPQSKTLWLNETKTFLIATPKGLMTSERIIR